METGEISRGGDTRMTQHPLGLGLEIGRDGVFVSDVPYLRRRDLCARATFIAYDPSIMFQVLLRRDTVGLASTHYALALSIARQAGCIIRVTSTHVATHATLLIDWQRHPAIGMGHPVECELRAQGATLEARIAGHVLARVHEPRLGIGCPALRVEADDAPGRAVCVGFEIREVTR